MNEKVLEALTLIKQELQGLRADMASGFEDVGERLQEQKTEISKLESRVEGNEKTLSVAGGVGR